MTFSDYIFEPHGMERDLVDPTEPAYKRGHTLDWVQAIRREASNRSKEDDVWDEDFFLRSANPGSDYSHQFLTTLTRCSDLVRHLDPNCDTYEAVAKVLFDHMRTVVFG